MPPIDLHAADHLLTTTRSVRRRLDVTRPVPPEIIEGCLEIAIQAPTGGNTQMWRWVVVTDEGHKRAIADFYRQATDPYLAFQEQQIAPGDTQQQRVVASARHLMDIMADMPALIIPCHLGRWEGRGDRFPDQVASNVAASGFYGSIWPAVWSLMLALRARGIGSALTTLHLIYEREVASLLGIPDDVTQVGLLPVAYFTGDDFKPAARRPAREITYWDGWKNTR